MNAIPPAAGPAPRIPWVDVAKAIGIGLVFYGHLVEPFIGLGLPGAEYQMKWIYAFHMPLFFFLVGFVYKDRGVSFAGFIRRQIRTRLVPAWVFNIVAMVAWLIQEYARGESPLVRAPDWPLLAQDCLTRLLGMLLKGRYSWNVLTWFLFCLFTVELWQFLLRPLLRRNRNVAACALGFGVLVVLTDYYSDALYTLFGVRRHWWYITSGMSAMVFYQLGILMRRAGWLDSGSSRARSVLIGVACLAFTLLTFNMNRALNTNSPSVVLMIDAKYGSVWWFFATSIAGTLLIVYISQIFSGSRALRYVGRITLALMCLDGLLHRFLNPGLAAFTVRLVPEPNILLFTGICLLFTVISIVICIPATALLGRYLPFTLGARRKQPASATHSEQRRGGAA